MGERMVKDLHGKDVEPFWYHNLSGSSYKIRVEADFAGLTEHLGQIVQRHDNRFDWFRKDTRYYKGQWDGVAQGVADTLSEAITAVEKGWVK